MDDKERQKRDRIWLNIDKNTKDSQGSPITYGATYRYERGGMKYNKVAPCGPDLRGNAGWVFCYIIDSGPTRPSKTTSGYAERQRSVVYEPLCSEGLTPVDD